MFTDTVILAGTVVIEGVAFRWSVTDGLAQQLTVTNPTLGTQTENLTASPDAQARSVGRAMLRRKACSPVIGYIDVVDDVPLLEVCPEPPSIA